jgi:hypothetical protein
MKTWNNYNSIRPDPKATRRSPFSRAAAAPRLFKSGAGESLVVRVHDVLCRTVSGVCHHRRLHHSQSKLERGLCTLVADLLPQEMRPLFLADAGYIRAGFIRWLQRMGFDFVVCLRPDTMIDYRGERATVTATLSKGPLFCSPRFSTGMSVQSRSILSSVT